MLDRMRRHKNWLKWSLALVVLTFVLFYIPDFLGFRNGAGSVASHTDVVAQVEGRPVTVAEFRRVYNSQIQAYRGAYGGSINEQLLRQLGIDRQILQQLIDERAALVEAGRLGIDASDSEVRQRILNIPAFQENGQFIGEQRYRQLLSLQNPPISVDEFEDSVRRSIVLEKLRSALTDWIAISDTEIDREFRQRNEKVKLEVVAIPGDRFREGVTATDAEIASHFEGHKDEFRIGEKRRIRFIAVDAQKLRDQVNVLPRDIERAYNQNIEQYTTPEQVRASQILIKTEGRDEAAVRKQAEQVLVEVKAGGDFAALAAKYSEDDASKDKSGDLDFFGKGRMVPEFEQAAFALQPGQTSDLVKTQYGFHIIKVTDRKASSVRTLDEVRQQIADQLKWERAQAQVQQIASELEAEIGKPGDFETAARSHGLSVQESGFFQRDEPIVGLGPSPEVSTEAFSLKDGEVGGPVRTPQGMAFLTVVGRQESRLPKLDEVKDRVREAVIRRKANGLAIAKARELEAALKGETDLAAAAKAAGFEPKTSELLARGGAIPEVGASRAVDLAAFSLPVGSVSDVITTDNAAVIVKVLERKDVEPKEIAAGREALRDDLLNERRGRFYSAYMSKAKQRMKITIDRETLSRLIA
jgi:peptidyl-prolyl cis-trans isomerase D